MNRIFFVVLLSLSITGIFGQNTAPTKYWIQLTDKNNSPYSINNPSQYLSQKAITRRTKQGINIKQNDIPVNPSYIDSIKSTGVTVLHSSKWFNAVTIYTIDTNALALIDSFSFVKNIQNVAKIGTKKKDKKTRSERESEKLLNDLITKIIMKELRKTLNMEADKSLIINYGLSYNQINMIGGVYLHDLGYLGNGITIAVLDGGFYAVDTMAAFDSLWYNNQILGTRDFVDPGGNVFQQATHGMFVLSTMGANIPGELVGTAPKANYWLLRSEDTGTEYLIEEDNWVAAAEFADSVGVDIINSSLGYTTFNDTTQNHTYDDMNGETTRVTIAADIAASKGILVVNSAGNSGASAWTYIGAPADGDSVFTIGGVDPLGNYAAFSSVGPTSDGRLKPNVVAQGQATVIAAPSGGITAGNGTSFASPIIAGMSACLWQANPNLTNMQLAAAIEESSSNYFTPDSLKGYGIPNYTVANVISSGIPISNFDTESKVDVFPNPFEKCIYILYQSSIAGNITIEIFDNTGRKVYYSNDVSNNCGINCITIDEVGGFAKGMYLLVVSNNDKISSTKIFKFK
ncbi:S8 family serine peptidase [Bacteroidota bacterium]